MVHKAWSSIEEVPYCFLGSSIKFRGHTGWKIDDLNPIWVRLPGRSQLSNPSDLPCLLADWKWLHPIAITFNTLCLVEFYTQWHGTLKWTRWCSYLKQLICSCPAIYFSGKATKVGSPPNFPKLMSQLWETLQSQYFVTSLFLYPHWKYLWKYLIYYKNETKVGSQHFGYQIWFCTRLLILNDLENSTWRDLKKFICQVLIDVVFNKFLTKFRKSRNLTIVSLEIITALQESCLYWNGPEGYLLTVWRDISCWNIFEIACGAYFLKRMILINIMNILYVYIKMVTEPS